ncbi:TraX family protein [Pseudomonas entomophila]|uniref:TraX family protein n=1 Tax=Pseudomonas entomophila TaxID=312306 RepID=UPI0023D81522|nr:TraX family protein [Pseudomonas entomophila]MDF0732891.1 TraX family protein [Pseudomonas entomophila]
MSGRSAGLDLVKWLAMLTMVVDHLRYLWPAADGLFVVGRLAFPLFCLAIAVNVARSRPDAPFTPGNARYLAWMLAFSVISEAPYRWLDNATHTFNVMLTLTLGLLVAWGAHQRPARYLGMGAALLAALVGERLMYGLPGVLLPAACLLALQRGGALWLLPCALAMAGNLTNSWLLGHLWQPFTLTVLAIAALAPPLGERLRRYGHWRVPPVGRWGYAFYPLHLLVIKGLLLWAATPGD